MDEFDDSIIAHLLVKFQPHTWLGKSPLNPNRTIGIQKTGNVFVTQ
jgi:hypothetical protein